ncbi:stomatin-4 isoform X2 [Eurytemora carolleeae]|uniref:stomatin-4 isoform X2 n=1 Tax=Eurytemora carolleeae TaxID=1294199 RepID=UPI000C780714|nr:stomatin-4 isoform X2 [Eurytemora carolleeae]|eukprot:XP_023327178.1 stomatin-4-like isoform X2 [Eurytemora affinis]
MVEMVKMNGKMIVGTSSYQMDEDEEGYAAVSEWSENSKLRWFTTGFLHVLSYLLVFLTAPISFIFVLRKIPEYERAVVLGSTLEMASVRGPGLIFVLPFLEKIRRIDTRTKVFEVPPQQILSTDSVTLTVDAVIYYRVHDPVRAAIRVQDYNQSVRSLAASTLGSILGTYKLSALLSHREEIAKTVLSTFKHACDPWGITVERVEVKNLCVAREMVKSMAVEAQAFRNANGLVIMQKGEGKCLEKIRAAADEMQSCPTSLVLKYLQVLNNISREKNHTIVLPIPSILLNHFSKPSS